MKVEWSKNPMAGNTEIQTSPQGAYFAGRTENKTSPQRDSTAGNTDFKTSPHSKDFAGNTEIQSSPCCGEDTTPTGINKNPASVVTVVGKDGLQLSPPCPFPLPVTKKFRSKKMRFNTLTR